MKLWRKSLPVADSEPAVVSFEHCLVGACKWDEGDGCNLYRLGIFKGFESRCAAAYGAPE